MARELSYKKVDEYFQSIVDRHVDLKEFIGASIDELSQKLASFDSAQSPFLLFYEYKNKLQGNTQRTLNQKSLSFIIAYTAIPHMDFAAQKQAIDDAEIIGLEVLSRIYLDSKGQDVKWLYNNFQKESCFYEPFEGEEMEGLYGMDFHFDIIVPEPLVATPNKWTDGNTICT